MCTMFVVLNREMLGSREACWSLFDGKQMTEKTSHEIKELITKSKKKVCGLTLDKDGELVLDKEGFFCRNIMEHRRSNSYQPMVEEDLAYNLFYIIIGSRTDTITNETVYDCISTRMERLTISESDVKSYLKLGIISAGARLTADDKIELASLDFNTLELKPVPVEKVPEQLKPIEPIKTEVKEKVAEPEKKTEPPKQEVKESEKKSEPSKPTEPKKAPTVTKPEQKPIKK